MILQTNFWNITLLFLFWYLLPGVNAFANSNLPPAACDLGIEVPDDITICDQESISLDGVINGDYLSFVWTQDGDFLTDSDLDPSVYIEESTSFTLTAYQLSDENLIINGDFESGDWIEYTDYFVGTNSCYGFGYLDCEGAYGVLDNPNDGHTGFAACGDHTGGGDMMVVNGAPSYQQIWCQTIPVEPDGIYFFSACAASVNPGSPAELQFAIDGNLIGNLFSLTSTVCAWEEFTAEWEANGETSIQICITNQNTAAGGNDFALDDIAFQQICEEQASFDVTYAEYEVLWNSPDDLLCNDPETEIIIELIPENYYDIIWDTDDGNIIDIYDDGLVVLVNHEGEYTATISNPEGCVEEIDIEVESDQEAPDIEILLSNHFDCANDSAIIEVETDQNNIEYNWYDSSGAVISNENVLLVTNPGSYLLNAINDFTGCEALDTVEV